MKKINVNLNFHQCGLLKLWSIHTMQYYLMDAVHPLKIMNWIHSKCQLY